MQLQDCIVWKLSMVQEMAIFEHKYNIKGIEKCIVVIILETGVT